jgi:hypothetical protein
LILAFLFASACSRLFFSLRSVFSREAASCISFCLAASRVLMIFRISSYWKRSIRKSNIYLSSCLFVWIQWMARLLDQSSPNLVWGPGHRLCFGPRGSGGALNRVWRASTATTVRLGNFFIKKL